MPFDMVFTVRIGQTLPQESGQGHEKGHPKLSVFFCTKSGRREPRQRQNGPPKGAQDGAPGAKWPTGGSLQHLLTLVEASGVQELVPRASTNTPAHHDVAQHFSVIGLSSMGGQVAWDTVCGQAKCGPVPRIRCGSRSAFNSFVSKLSIARSCMGWHIAVDSLRPREARPEFHSVASTGEQMAWDRLQPREAGPGRWLSETHGAG